MDKLDVVVVVPEARRSRTPTPARAWAVAEAEGPTAFRFNLRGDSLAASKIIQMQEAPLPDAKSAAASKIIQMG